MLRYHASVIVGALTWPCIIGTLPAWCCTILFRCDSLPCKKKLLQKDPQKYPSLSPDVSAVCLSETKVSFNPDNRKHLGTELHMRRIHDLNADTKIGENMAFPWWDLTSSTVYLFAVLRLDPFLDNSTCVGI